MIKLKKKINKKILMIMIINNGVENGKVYGKELESNKIEDKERIEIHKTEEKEDENQEDETKGDKKNNIITLAIGGSIVLIVILALIISTIKNKSKKSEGKELETSFNSIFNIDKIDYVLNQNSMSSSSLIRINNKYLIELSDTEEQETKFISTSDKTKQEIQSIWLLHPGSKSGRPIPTIIISKKDYKIKFYNHQYNNHSNEWYYQVYKEISLKPLNIPSNTEDKTQEESDKKVKNELKNNSFNENITSSIENFLTDLRISSTVNREEIIKFLTNIKKNLDKEIEIYLQQQKEALAK